MAGKYCFLLHNSYYVPDSISDNGRTESEPLSPRKAPSALQRTVWSSAVWSVKVGTDFLSRPQAVSPGLGLPQEIMSYVHIPHKLFQDLLNPLPLGTQRGNSPGEYPRIFEVLSIGQIDPS